MPKLYAEHEGRVVSANGQFKHIMAVTLDPRTGNKEGIIRCIVSREGNVAVRDFVDRSVLYKIKGDSLGKFEIGEKLNIKNDKKWIDQLTGLDGDFLGLEDPDIWIDEETGFMHVYFTMPVKKGEHRYSITLGHAIGKDLDSLEMVEPALVGSPGQSAKEVSIAPLNSKGIHLNLIESSLEGKTHWCSAIRIAVAKDMNKPWKFGKTIFNPLTTDKTWIAGHASPGPLLPDSFINIGEGKRLGILNGRVADLLKSILPTSNFNS